MRDSKLNILSEKIEDLTMSLDFKKAAKVQGYQCLNDLIHIRTADLEKKPGFNILLIHEYVNFMEEAGLGGLIDPRLV